MEIKQALELRKILKGKKPKFIKQDAHKKKRLDKKWKRPRGLHSKIRLCKKGYRRGVTKGWGSPGVAKGLDKNGMIPVVVSNVAELSKINGKTESALISNVGQKKRAEILRKAKELKLIISNVNDIGKELEKIDAFVKERKDRKTKRAERKVKSEEKKKTKEKKGESIDKKLEETEEEKKTREKKEMDKVLTKKND